MSDRGYSRFWNLNLESVQALSFILFFFFCMLLISLHYQKNYEWLSLKCHTSPPPNPWGVCLSPLRPSLFMGWRRMTFQTQSMDIYVHPGINKGGIQRKHIFLLWVGRKGHNKQTLSFSTDD